jgi:hypothetical protein
MRKQHFLAMIVIGLSVAFLAHFGLIAYYGEVTVREPHPLVLAVEMAVLTGFVVFASLNVAK